MKKIRARRPWISHQCRGVSPRGEIVGHTSPGFPTFATLGSPESRASIVIRRRAFLPSNTPSMS